jgi:prolyl oligopeptidase
MQMPVMNHSALLVTLAVACACGPARAAGPPIAARIPVVDTYFDRKVTDDYRWMEDAPKPEFFDYLHAQDDFARHALAAIPGREGLAREISAVSDLTAYTPYVQLAGGRAFYRRIDPGAPIARLYMRDAAGTETLLVDPITFDSSGKHAALDQFAVSQDGMLVVFGIGLGGSENSVLHVIETATRQMRRDEIDRARFAHPSWAPDGKSFFYTRLAKTPPKAAATEQFAHIKVYRHALGGDPDQDTEILDSDHLPFAFPAPQTIPTLTITPGSDYALAVISDGVSPESAYFAAPLRGLGGAAPGWRLVARQPDGVTDTSVQGNRLYALSHAGASRFKVIDIALDAPDIARARIVVPEPKGVLTGIAAARDALYYTERDGAVSTLHRLAEGGTRAETLALPFAGTIYADGGLVADRRRDGIVFSLESWVRPLIWLRYDPAYRTLTDTGIVPKFPRDMSGYDSVETFARAKDGKMIPLSIVSRKGLARDGRRPTYLVGYGAYGDAYDPYFNSRFLPWLDHGGVLAIAHVRGGGEGGQAWHDAGKMATKRNTIDDFIACAEDLIKLGYTDSAHLGGEGTSAGGIMIGGAITERPDLFRAALIRVGITNALRFENSAGGPANVAAFGTVRNAAQFPALLAMDAYAHVAKGVAYPAVLLTGGANDQRVPVWMPAKMTAKLQADTASGRPILFRVEFDAGHGMGSTRAQLDQEIADEFAFLLWQFGETGFRAAPTGAAK